jgi:glucokinase
LRKDELIMINNKKLIGIDLGGTNVRVARIGSGGIEKMESEGVYSKGTVDEVLSQIFNLVERIGTDEIYGIGMGVPGPVDEKSGIVYELINIPAWKKVEIGEIFKTRYNLPVRVQNDANCFAVAEKYYGKGKNCKSFIGLIVGTGMAGGIFINDQLYTGPNCMAGEFGMMKYLDKFYEYYSCGQFFDNVYGISGKDAAEKANKGDKDALAMFREFGKHLGTAIEAILYAYDPEMIVLGGSVSKSFHLYEKYLWEVLEEFAFKNSLKNFKIETSELNNPGLLGAAALHFLK